MFLFKGLGLVQTLNPCNYEPLPEMAMRWQDFAIA